MKPLKEKVSITYKQLPMDIHDGDRILIDDGLIEMHVVSHNETEIVCMVDNGGPVSNRKGINVPGVRLSMPYISEQDRSDIIFGAQLGFDFIAASFATKSPAAASFSSYRWYPRCCCSSASMPARCCPFSSWRCSRPACTA